MTATTTRTEPGCDEGNHTHYWIGCTYCDQNKASQNEALTTRLRFPRTPFGKLIEKARRVW